MVEEAYPSPGRGSPTVILPTRKSLRDIPAKWTSSFTKKNVSCTAVRSQCLAGAGSTCLDAYRRRCCAVLTGAVELDELSHVRLDRCGSRLIETLLDDHGKAARVYGQLRGSKKYVLV